MAEKSRNFDCKEESRGICLVGFVFVRKAILLDLPGRITGVYSQTRRLRYADLYHCLIKSASSCQCFLSVMEAPDAGVQKDIHQLVDRNIEYF